MTVSVQDETLRDIQLLLSEMQRMAMNAIRNRVMTEVGLDADTLPLLDATKLKVDNLCLNVTAGAAKGSPFGLAVGAMLGSSECTRSQPDDCIEYADEKRRDEALKQFDVRPDYLLDNGG